MIELADVSKVYGRTAALKNLTFGATAGSMTVLKGPNGCGKSTALKIAVGLTLPDSGSVNLTAVSPGYVGHTSQMVSSLSIKRNLLMQHGLVKEPLGVLLEYAAHFGVTEFWHKKPPQLSQGMMQRSKLARAFAAGKQLLVLDEPQTGLDARGISILWEQVETWVVAGGAVLVASHLSIPEFSFPRTEIEIVAGGLS